MTATWYKLDRKVKEVLDSLITKVDSGGCFSTTPLEEIRDTISWYNLDNKVKDIVDYLTEQRYPTNINRARWYKLPYTVKDLEDLVEVFDCLNIPDIEAPTAPANLASSNITATSVQLDWDVSTDDREVDFYNIYKDGTVTDTRVGNTATLSGLTASTSYDFYVTAVDTSGNESEPSNTVNVTTTA